eukprot:1969300-Lingulodinium_polyedra.AAC.1
MSSLLAETVEHRLVHARLEPRLVWSRQRRNGWVGGKTDRTPRQTPACACKRGKSLASTPP